ncbi:MAG TPA: EF-hand domain-containing protein [Arenimonas sp.]|nr:EF-hand domain-containing protein [Arenimonas sp.]
MKSRIPMLARAPLACLALLVAGPVLAAELAPDPVEVGPKVQLETRTGPVTVISVQPSLPDYEEYQVTVPELDENNDGRLSRSEVPDDHALHFEWHIVDSNSNGYISNDELDRWKSE